MNSIKLLNRMDTIFTKSEKSKTCGFYRLLLNFSDKINLKRSSNYVALFDLSIYYSQENVKKSQKNNKLKASAPTWSKKFELPDRSNSVSDIQNYFNYIMKKHPDWLFSNKNIYK